MLKVEACINFRHTSTLDVPGSAWAVSSISYVFSVYYPQWRKSMFKHGGGGEIIIILSALTFAEIQQH